jgi:hypothetical protein
MTNLVAYRTIRCKTAPFDSGFFANQESDITDQQLGLAPIGFPAVNLQATLGNRKAIAPGVEDLSN